MQIDLRSFVMFIDKHIYTMIIKYSCMNTYFQFSSQHFVKNVLIVEYDNLAFFIFCSTIIDLAMTCLFPLYDRNKHYWLLMSCPVHPSLSCQPSFFSCFLCVHCVWFLQNKSDQFRWIAYSFFYYTWKYILLSVLKL